MKFRNPFYSVQARMMLLLVALAWPGNQVFSAEEESARSVAESRAAQAQELSNLREEYAAKARQPGADQAKLLSEYKARYEAIRQKFLAADTRAAEIQDIKDRFRGEIENTGSNPKDVRADVDLAARNEQAARTLAEEWRAKGDVVVETPTKYVNQTRDATLWRPETPEIKQAKVEDLDAFSTEGGQEGTGNKSAVRDELGWQIDNEKKLLHAQNDGDLKTGAKSVDKAAEAAGRKAQNPEFYRKAEVLRQYGDDVQAGITDLADTPEVRKQKLDAWREEARIEMDKSRAVAERRSALRDDVRADFQRALENATPADPANRDANFRDSAAIGDERVRVRESNLAAERMNETLRAESGGKTTIEAGGRGSTVREGTTTRIGEPAPDVVTTIKPGEAGPIARNTTIGQPSPQAAESVAGSVPDSSGVGDVVPVEPPGSLSSSAGSSGGRPSLDQFTPKIDPSQVQMPGRIERTTRYVSGDPALADLAEPGVKHVQAPPPNPELAELVRNIPSQPSKPAAPVDVQMPGPVERPTRYVSGDPALADLAEPGVKHVQAPPPDADLAALARGDYKPPARSGGANAGEQTVLSSGSQGPNLGEGTPTTVKGTETRLSSGSTGPNMGEGTPTKLQPADTRLSAGSSGANLGEGSQTRLSGVQPEATTAIEPGGSGPRVAEGLTTRAGGPAANTAIEPGGSGPQVRSGTKTALGEASVSSAGGVNRPSLQDFAPQIDPSQVQMPGRAEPTVKYVKGDPVLADLAEPGVRHLQGGPAPGDPTLADLLKGGSKPRGGGAGAAADTVIGGEGSGGARAGEGTPTKVGQAQTTINPEGPGGPNRGEGSTTKVREGAGSTEAAGPKAEGPRIRKILNVANEVVGGMAVAGQLGEAGTKQAGDVIDENRDFTVGDAGEALVEGAGIPSMYQMGRDISAEEQIRVQQGQQGQAAALGRTYVRMADKMAHEMINDPVDRAIAEEEARAAAAGEEPDYTRSTYNAATDVGGKFTGLGALANAVEETTTWDERADYAAQRGAMDQFVDENVGRSSTRIRNLQGEIEQLSLTGDMNDPDTAAQIEQRIAQMDAEYDKLNRVSGMAQRTLGQESAQSVDQQIASLPRRDDFTGYIDENVTARGGKIDSTRPAGTERATAPGSDTGAQADLDIAPADEQRLVNSTASAGLTTVGSPQQAGAPSLTDALRGIGDRIKNEAENQVIKEVTSNPQPYVRGALQGLNAESDDSRRIRQMYNSAPEGSDDRRQLNGLFEQLRDARTPEQRAAAQAEIERWSDKYPPPATAPATVPVLPTKDDLLTDRNQSADRVRQHNEYINQLQQNGGSKEDIESAQWIRDQEQQRLEGYDRSLSSGEFQQPAAPAESSAPPSPATTASTLAPAGAAPEEVPAEPEEPRSASGYTAGQLQNDNYNMQNLADDAQNRINNLQQQMADSHNSTERRDLQEQIDKERAELNSLQERIDGNNAELTEMGAETGDGVKPPPSPWTEEQLQNDNWNMQNLAEGTQNRIDNLEQQLAASRDGSERRDLQEQIDKERAELNNLQERMDGNDAALTAMGAEPGTGEQVEIGPWSQEQLENDNWNMQNLAERTQGRIDDLEQRIRDSRDGSERRDLQEQLDRERAELGGLQERIDGNNEQLGAMAAAGGAGEEEQGDTEGQDDSSESAAESAGSSVFDGAGADSADATDEMWTEDEPAGDEESDVDDEPDADGEQLASDEPEYGEGDDGYDSGDVDPNTEGGIQQFAEATESRLGADGSAEMNIIRVSSDGRIAETRSDAEANNADNIRDQGGAEAQQTVNEAATEVAAGDRQDSWGNVIGNSAQTGFEQGGQALGTALGGSGADHVSGQAFGSKPSSGSDSGSGEGNENGDDAGQGDAVATGSSPAVPPPAPPPVSMPPPSSPSPAPAAPSTPSSGYGNCPRCNIPFIQCSDGAWRCPNSAWVRQNPGGARPPAAPAPAPTPVVVPSPTYGPLLQQTQPNLTPVQLNAAGEPMFAPGQNFGNTYPVPYGGPTR